MKKDILKYFGISLFVIALDQIVKMLVHFNMEMYAAGEIKVIGNLFRLYYLTNPGMAFGIKLDFEYGKMLLSLFRIGAMFAIGYYLYTLIKTGANKGFLVTVAMILGGAIGNLIDSIFYGVWLDNAPYDAPTPWFNGQVVDMFYIDLWKGHLPNWIPIIGGDYMALWPVFNIADASIFIAICIILIFQKRYFKKEEELVETSSTSDSDS